MSLSSLELSKLSSGCVVVLLFFLVVCLLLCLRLFLFFFLRRFCALGTLYLLALETVGEYVLKELKCGETV